MLPVAAIASVMWGTSEREVMPEDRKEIFKQLAVYSQAGLSFVVSILVGFGMGWAIDNKVFNGRTAPYLTFIFLGLGIAAGFKGLWDLTRRINDA